MSVTILLYAIYGQHLSIITAFLHGQERFLQLGRGKIVYFRPRMMLPKVPGE